MEYFIGAYKDKYADFSGRARRKEYWMFYLFYILTVIVLAFLMGVVSEINETLSTFVAAIFVLFVIGSIIPTLAITARRLHDLNMSGWWQLLFLIPYVGSLVIFIFTLLPGTKGVNRFGLDPLVQVPIEAAIRI